MQILSFSASLLMASAEGAATPSRADADTRDDGRGYQCKEVVAPGAPPAQISADMVSVWMKCERMGTVDVYGGGGNVWGLRSSMAGSVYGAGKPMNARNMAVECDLRTLCIFGNTWEGGRRLDMEDHLADYPTYRLLGNYTWLAGPGEIPEVVWALFVMPLEPVTRLPSGLRDICYCLAYTFPAHMGRVHGENLSPYPGILFVPVCFFEISLARLAHDMSEINGSASPSLGGLNLEQTFVCSYSSQHGKNGGSAQGNQVRCMPSKPNVGKAIVSVIAVP